MVFDSERIPSFIFELKIKNLSTIKNNKNQWWLVFHVFKLITFCNGIFLRRSLLCWIVLKINICTNSLCSVLARSLCILWKCIGTLNESPPFKLQVHFSFSDSLVYCSYIRGSVYSTGGFWRPILSLVEKAREVMQKMRKNRALDRIFNHIFSYGQRAKVILRDN